LKRALLLFASVALILVDLLGLAEGAFIGAYDGKEGFWDCANSAPPKGATGSGDPRIGDLFVAPMVPALVAVPLLLITGAGFYIHGWPESRASSGSWSAASAKLQPPERLTRFR
jgi:hypothetical protein